MHSLLGDANVEHTLPALQTQHLQLDTPVVIKLPKPLNTIFCHQATLATYAEGRLP